MKRENFMRFCVVTASFNPGRSLLSCAESVRSNGAFGHWVMDKVSTDGSIKLLEPLPGFRHVISAPDKGIYDAMNKGIVLAPGEVVSFLNADDSYLPGILEKVRAAFEEHPDAEIVHGNIVVNGRTVRPPSGLASFRGCRIFHPACFIKRSVFEKTGKFSLDYPICADLDFFLRAKEQGIVFYYLDVPLTVFSTGGISCVRRKQAAREVVRILRAHGFSVWFAASFYLAARFRAFASAMRDFFTGRGRKDRKGAGRI